MKKKKHQQKAVNGKPIYPVEDRKRRKMILANILGDEEGGCGVLDNEYCARNNSFTIL